MSTTTINQPNGNSSDKKKNVASHAATAAAAAGLAAAGAMAMDSNQEVPPVAEEVQEVSESSASQPQDNQNLSVSANTNNSQTNNVSSENTDTATEDLQPITESAVETPIEDEDVIEIDESEVAEVENEVDASISQETSNATISNEQVNPDEVAEAIISEEQVDPNDIDMANVVNFDEIGTVYTVDGESYTAAAFHDAAGNQLVMVDVDGDNVFDIVTDMEGNPLVDPNGNLVAAGDLTVDDAEIGISDVPTYLASNDTDTTDEFGADTIANDMIS